MMKQCLSLKIAMMLFFHNLLVKYGWQGSVDVDHVLQACGGGGLTPSLTSGNFSVLTLFPPSSQLHIIGFTVPYSILTLCTTTNLYLHVTVVRRHFINEGNLRLSCIAACLCLGHVCYLHTFALPLSSILPLHWCHLLMPSIIKSACKLKRKIMHIRSVQTTATQRAK